MKNEPIPKVGMRNIKTACATALCVLIYYFFDRNPTFACIGSIFGMGTDLQSSKQHGGNRLFGTVIGGALGMALFSVLSAFFTRRGGRSLLLAVFGICRYRAAYHPCQIFWKGGVQPGGVMLCILLFNTPVDSYISYALNRILDTAVGVIIALIVNSAFPGGFKFRFHSDPECESQPNSQETSS